MAGTVSGIGLALPEHVLGPAEVLAHLQSAWSGRLPRWGLLEQFVRNAGVEQRHFAYPPARLLAARSLEEKSREYLDAAVELGRTAVTRALEASATEPGEIDLFITVSCTGFLIPSLDAHLMNQLPFSPRTRRLPITELGCVAGSVALARAADYLAARPGANALILAVELPSLTFQPTDHSIANLVSTALFGDGAAACVVHGDGRAGLQIEGSLSHFFPRSLRQMAFDLKDTGFFIRLGKEVPQLIGSSLRRLVAELFDGDGQPSFWCLHPGGPRVLEAMEEALGLSREDTRWSRRVLARHGNLSSATVLFILAECLASAPQPREGERGLLAAFGPGFSAELVALRWRPP